MDNEEKYIKECSGCENPFRVPTGYFEQITDCVMAQLPSREVQSNTAEVLPLRAKRHHVTLRRWLYAAACIVIVAIMSVSFLFNKPSQADESILVSTVSADSQYMDAAADYVMLDNAEIYACLTE